MAESPQIPSRIPLTLVVISGLPGAGKSVIAVRVARHLRLALLELDRLEAPLLLQGISGDAIGWSTYGALTALASQNLDLGVSVAIDSVAWTNRIRAEWQQAAARSGAAFRPIEVICTDSDLHRDRLKERVPTKGGSDRMAEAVRIYEPWALPRLELDSARPLDDLVLRAITYIGNSEGS